MLKSRLSFAKNLIWDNKLLNRPRIFWATIYLNYACNYKCKHCYGKYGENYGGICGPEDTLSLNQVKLIVDKLHGYGCRYIAFLGGEPLLHEDLKAIIHFIRSKGIELSIITNGSLIKKRLDDLREVSTLCFSIDGGRESNDYLRGEGAYQRSIDAIKLVKKNLKVNVHINATIYKKSIEHMDELFDEAKKLNCYIGFCPLMYQSYLDPMDEYLRPSDEDYKSFYSKVIDLKKKGYPIMYSNYSYKTMQRWPNTHQPIMFHQDAFNINSFGFPPCWAGNNFLYIGAQGNVYPCSQLVETDKFAPKNIFKDGFEEAWQNAKEIPCSSCTSIGFLDINMMLSLKIRSLFSMAIQSLKESNNKRDFL